MIEKLKTLQTLLGKEDLVLTGSTALAYHGLLEMTEAKDLDLILVEATTEAKSILDKLQAESPSKKHHINSPVNYSFIYEGVKVDIWLVDSHEKNEYLYTKDGVKVGSIQSIVKAKKGYNRPKDWIQLMQLANKIFSKVDFEKQLPAIVQPDGEYNEN